MTNRNCIRVFAVIGLLAGTTACDRFKGMSGQNSPPPVAGMQPEGYPQGAMPPGAMPPGAMQPGAMPPGGMTPGTNTSLSQLAGFERQDFGVPASEALHEGAAHAPTPTQIPGGQLITTEGLIPLMQGAAGTPIVILDVLGSPQQLPRAFPAVFAAQGGNYNDATQQQLAQMLMQLTNGNRQIPIVTYCQGPHCWMSYNAALRAIKLGYTNVLWYRGGLEAWAQAMQLMSGMPPVQGGQMMPPTQSGPTQPSPQTQY